ncbi:MAG TPA: carbonic anhydrase [Longimicrobiales bacterium]|nr:carbonic anhydrase [Longimicrobiales bacterium]
MPNRLLEGLRRFRREDFPAYREHYQRLVEEGQKPTTLFIGCSDSRVVPDLITGAMPGELFIVRNVGNLVPPFEADAGYHGVSAGIEFAVLTLGVTDIVVCGHTHCGAIRALYDPPNASSPHVTRWLELAQEARLDGPVSESILRRTEQRSVAIQLERLLTFPMVAERVERGEVSLHGWHYVIEEGRVDVLDIEAGEFRPA